jgi:monoamine oxidase
MPMGSAIKCVATYDSAFWRIEGWSGEAVSDTGPVQLAFDASGPRGDAPALVGFVLGERARHWGAEPEGDRRAAVLASFARFFGDAALEPLDYLEKDWCADPWSRGCPVAVLPAGALTACGAAIREPCGRIHWAGTETATRSVGYMDGAVEAGERAAAEVRARL